MKKFLFIATSVRSNAVFSPLEPGIRGEFALDIDDWIEMGAPTRVYVTVEAAPLRAMTKPKGKKDAAT